VLKSFLALLFRGLRLFKNGLCNIEILISNKIWNLEEPCPTLVGFAAAFAFLLAGWSGKRDPADASNEAWCAVILSAKDCLAALLAATVPLTPILVPLTFALSPQPTVLMVWVYRILLEKLRKELVCLNDSKILYSRRRGFCGS